MFNLVESHLFGCYKVQPRVLNDERGSFIKIFHFKEFERFGLETNFMEEYYSHSKKDVIRGMHFQAPPSDHVKMVYCVQGEVLDVVLDLRNNSPTFGMTDSIYLSAKKGNYLYIPKGLAHGFLVTSETATLVYKVSTIYDPNNDSGILWNSFGFDWPIHNPIISSRDSNLIPFVRYESPFFNE